MNNNINEAYCSFEIAKLLKEKGFDCLCNRHYELSLTSKKYIEDDYSGPFGWEKGELNLIYDINRNSTLNEFYDGINWYACSVPTHALAIEWIRVNYGIYISIHANKPCTEFWYDAYGQNGFWYMGKNLSYPQEATEAALHKVLNNIKDEK